MQQPTYTTLQIQYANIIYTPDRILYITHKIYHNKSAISCIQCYNYQTYIIDECMEINSIHVIKHYTHASMGRCVRRLADKRQLINKLVNR